MWRSFARLLTQFDHKKLEPNIALRNAVGVALPLAFGVAIGMPLGGVAVASGALQVAYSDGHDPYSERGFRLNAGLLALGGGGCKLPCPFCSRPCRDAIRNGAH